MNLSLYRKIFDNLPIGVFILKLIDEEKKEFLNLYINQANSEVVGLDFKPFEGKTLRESFPESYTQGLPDLYLKSLRTQKKIEVEEMVYADQNVESKTWILEIIPIDEKHIMLITENISDLKKAQHHLVQKNEALFRTNQEIEQFSYIASHDLQEPLRTLSSMSELLEQDLGPKLSGENLEMLRHIREAGRRMTKLVRGLMDYSRLGKNKVPGTVDLNRVLEEVKFDLSSRIAETKTTIHTSDLPEIQGYALELNLLFQNLIINAIKFVDQDTNPKIEIGYQDKEFVHEIYVSDNGIGIPAKAQERIFHIFQRLHNRNEFEGTGIGLAHCRKIVDMHGGKLWIESEKGKGSTFFFTLPKTSLPVFS